MRNKHILKLFTFLAVGAFLLIAEEEIVPEANNYSSQLGIGFSAGATSGMGFALRKHFENRLGLNIGAIVLGGKDEYRSWVWANIGGQAMYTIHQNQRKSFRLYSLLGASIFVNGDNNNYDNYGDSTSYANGNNKSFNYNNIYTIGAGIGMEFVIAQRISISLDVPVSVWIQDTGFNIWPIPNAALVYYLR